jgi:hypothetical protein
VHRFEQPLVEDAHLVDEQRCDDVSDARVLAAEALEVAW